MYHNIRNPRYQFTEQIIAYQNVAPHRITVLTLFIPYLSPFPISVGYEII